jgi:hypothetical protein
MFKKYQKLLLCKITFLCKWSEWGGENGKLAVIETLFLIDLLANLPPRDVTRQAKTSSHQK